MALMDEKSAAESPADGKMIAARKRQSKKKKGKKETLSKVSASGDPSDILRGGGKCHPESRMSGRITGRHQAEIFDCSRPTLLRQKRLGESRAEQENLSLDAAFTVSSHSFLINY